MRTFKMNLVKFIDRQIYSYTDLGKIKQYIYRFNTDEICGIALDVTNITLNIKHCMYVSVIFICDFWCEIAVKTNARFITKS